MQVKTIDINIAEIGKARLKEFADENGVVAFPEFFEAYSNINHIIKGNVTYFAKKNDFEKYCEVVEKCYTIATCKEMIEGFNSQVHLRIFQNLKSLNSESDIISFLVEYQLWKHFINIFPLWSPEFLEEFRVRVYLQHEHQYKIEYIPSAKNLISFREIWLTDEKTRAEQVFKIIENTKDPVNTRIERTVCLSTLKNYIKATHEALINLSSIDGEKEFNTGEGTHRVIILAYNYKVKAKLAESKTPSQWGIEVSAKRKQAAYSLNKGGSTTYKDPTAKELAKAVELLKEYPEAQKLAIKDLEGF